MKKKNLINSAAVIFCLTAIMYGNRFSTPALKWARELNASDISKIELVVMSSPEGKRYRRFDESEFSAITELIHESRGRYVLEPESIAGGGCVLYITMKDQRVHRVGNNGNLYLQIDGDSFAADYKWLYSWEKEYGLGTGNAEIPEDFEE